MPYWSTLYGTHLADEGQSNSPEEIIRKSEWTSITGGFWKIPHDNRVTFCFLAPLSDPTILIKVRNFLLHFHKIEGTTMERDSCFHIRDCFDSGLSVHWFPGRRMPGFSRIVNDMRMEGVRETCGNPTTLSRLVAPWRRIMYVFIFIDGSVLLTTQKSARLDDSIKLRRMVCPGRSYSKRSLSISVL